MSPRQVWPGVTIVTGTDTDVGKTVATAVLAAALHAGTADVVVVKPAQTGLAPGEAGGDVDVVAALSGVPRERCHEWVRLPEPLAPTTAARRAGIRVPSLRDHAARIADLADQHASVLVEGAGGVLVGLDGDGHGLLDMADALADLGHRPRFVVVTRAGLGTLNHTQLTCRAITDRGHHVAGLIVGSLPAPDVLARPDHLAVRCNLAELADLCSAPLLFSVPAHIGADPAAALTAAAAVPLDIE